MILRINFPEHHSGSGIYTKHTVFCTFITFVILFISYEELIKETLGLLTKSTMKTNSSSP